MCPFVIAQEGNAHPAIASDAVISDPVIGAMAGPLAVQQGPPSQEIAVIDPAVDPALDPASPGRP